MEASFTPQEQQTIDRLREKYGGLRDSQAIQVAEEGATSCVSCVPSTPQTGPSSTSVRPGSNVEASVCAYCHGTGTLVEIYNHRRLENFCKECDGRGVRVFKNGVEVEPGGGGSGSGAAVSGRSGDALTSSGVAGPAGVVALQSRNAAAARAGAAGGSSSDDVEAAGVRAAALQRDLQRIAAKMGLYGKERLDTMALLQQPHASAGGGGGGGGGAASADAEGREQAARGLVAQLDSQLERLELARRKKQAALDRLNAAAPPPRSGAGGGGGGVTLADIIANEGS